MAEESKLYILLERGDDIKDRLRYRDIIVALSEHDALDKYREKVGQKAFESPQRWIVADMTSELRRQGYDLKIINLETISKK